VLEIGNRKSQRLISTPTYRVAPKHGSDRVVTRPVQEVGQYWPRVELIDHTRVPAGAQGISLGAESSERIRIGGAGF
jgi:hypothetical protein